MLNKLRLKFVLINMGIVFSMLLVIFGMVYRFTDENLETQADTMLQTVLQAAQKPGVPQEQTDVTLPYFTLQVNSWGEVVAAGTYWQVSNEEFIEGIARYVINTRADEGELEEYGLRYVRGSAMMNQYYAFIDISSQSHTLSALIRTSVIIGISSLVAFLGISILLARWAVKPVQKAWQQQKQFVSDASHELKTPLTVIMSNAELLQNQSGTSEETAQYSQNILAMSHKMRALVEGLLELARVDNGQIKISFERLDLSALVCDAVLPFEPLFYERGLLLESHIAPDICVTGNAQYLRQTVEILLDNARKYSAPGTVTLTLQRQGKSCLLSVYNPGMPIPNGELEKIFERFYRTDQARTGGSFGLGLAIAKSTVEEHGGKIWANVEPFGNRFNILLPCEF